MGQFFDDIPPFLPPWLAEQEMFWVATAPLGGGGHVNVSPKGMRGCFHYVSPTKVWYQDLSGSGNETISHLREPGNGRITILFSAFQGPPRITRLFGTGTVHEYGTPEYDALIPVSERKPGSRSAIVIDVHKVGTSCGYAVPFYAFQAHRTKLLDFFDRREKADRAEGGRSEKGLQAYWALKNAESMDGMPGLESAFACERVPESVFDEAAEGRTSDACAADSEKMVVAGGARKWAYAGNAKFLLGLLMGVLLAVMYGQLQRWAVQSGKLQFAFM